MNGSRDIFEQSFSTNLLARDDLTRLVEKLRFVTMLKVCINIIKKTSKNQKVNIFGREIN